MPKLRPVCPRVVSAGLLRRRGEDPGRAPRRQPLHLVALLLLAPACGGQLETIGYLDGGAAPTQTPGGGAPPAATPAPTPAGPPAGGAPAAPPPTQTGGDNPSPGPAGPAPTPNPDPPTPRPPADPPRPRTAFLVVGNPANVAAADQKLKARLEELKFTVTLADDAGPADAVNAGGLVVISSSSSSGTVAGKFKDTPLPVIVLDAFILDDMKMTGGAQNTDFGTSSGAAVAVSAADHPLAGGLKNNVTVATANAEINWGKPAGAGQVAATVPNNADHAAIFGYDKGAEMVGQTAPHRRVGFFVSNTLGQRLNDDGLKFFDAAVEWAFRNE